MKRPSGWLANPQAMAAISKRIPFEGHAELSTTADADTWLTPRYILERLGTFDLDPCAAIQNPDWTGAKNKYTIEQDGLRSEWSGRVFMNPPFSNTAPWVEKHGSHGNGITLVPASVESIVWRKIIWKRSVAVLLLHGRTRFCNPDGSNTRGRPLRSIALIAWTPEDAAVLSTSGLAGVLIDRWKQT